MKNAATDIVDFVEAPVEILRVLSERTAQVRLPNGREVFGYLGSGAGATPLAAGERWQALLFVADFTRAELTGKAGG